MHAHAITVTNVSGMTGRPSSLGVWLSGWIERARALLGNGDVRGCLRLLVRHLGRAAVMRVGRGAPRRRVLSRLCQLVIISGLVTLLAIAPAAAAEPAGVAERDQLHRHGLGGTGQPRQRRSVARELAAHR